MSLLEPLWMSRASSSRCLRRNVHMKQYSSTISKRTAFTGISIHQQRGDLPRIHRKSRVQMTIPQRSIHGGGTAPTTLAEHREEVAKISESVRSFYERKEKFRIFHGSTNSTRKSAMSKDPNKVVDTSRLNHVVSVDTHRQTALVEPNVPMDRLVEETLKYGLVPPVVMEFVRTTYHRPIIDIETDIETTAWNHSRRRIFWHIWREQFLQARLL